MLIRLLIALSSVFLSLAACGSSERIESLYAQRCVGCHGPSGKGDGPVSASLPTPVPDFRETVQRRSVTQIRSIITQGRGMMPAYGPALTGAEIQDMVFMVRLLSQRDRPLEWWEKFEPLVYAHCSVPWEVVFGYDETGEGNKP